MQPQNLTFYHLGIAPKMLNVLEHMQFVSPTPIQYKAIPIALENKDLVGIAQTGTGKTLAFGIPIVQRLAAEPGRALILVPTRELAEQVNEALRAILRPFSLTSVVLIGGLPISKQITALRKQPRVLVATPGRLIDHLDRQMVDLRDVIVLVLDEADRMLDMGFAPQVERIINSMYRDRQTMLFSATMPAEITKLASQHMRLPIRVEIAPSGTAAERVSQELYIVEEKRKKTLLQLLLKQYRGSILLFTGTKIKAKRTARMIREMKHKAVEIHADRSMDQRKLAIEGFKTGRHRILVATDVAARGLDVSGIELVINYDLPNDIETYVHRIGRTGRAGHEGHAISFAKPDQRDDVEKIERLIRKTLPIANHPKFSSDSFSRSMKKPPTARKRQPASGRGRSPQRKRRQAR